MKQVILNIAVFALIIAGCNSVENNKPSIDSKSADTTQSTGNHAIETNASTKMDSKLDGSMNEMVAQYLQIKNALANDNGKDAASAGNAYVESMGKMDKNSLSGDKKMKWDDVSDDAKEMAEHIGKNADKLEHQREHFDMLSEDMYDLVKTFGLKQVLYQDFCPMANDKKGATWLSESKEIKNPYMGKKMPGCGSFKEELK